MSDAVQERLGSILAGLEVSRSTDNMAFQRMAGVFDQLQKLPKCAARRLAWIDLGGRYKPEDRARAKRSGRFATVGRPMRFLAPVVVTANGFDDFIDIIRDAEEFEIALRDRPVGE